MSDPWDGYGSHTLRIYGRMWLVGWTVLGGLGLLLGVGSWPVVGLVSVFLTSGVVVAVTIVSLPIAFANYRRMSAVQPGWRVVQAGLQGGLIGTTVLVSTSSLGGLVLPLLALAIATSPWTLRFGLRARSRPQQQGAPEPQETLPPEPDRVALQASDWAPAVQALSDEELCTSWRASYTMLQAARPADRVELVTLRQAYLDDLERRNPRGMQAWLRSGARAAGNPARYLTTDHPG